MRTWLAAAVVVLTACPGGDTDTDPDPDSAYTPDLLCPGDPGCAPSDDTELRAGAAVRSIEPRCYEAWEDGNGNLTWEPSDDTFFDCGCDRLCPGDDGYPGPDEGEGDGTFQRIYMGGGDINRPIQAPRGADQGLRGDNDGIWARAVALSQGETTVAIVALDTVGLQYDDTVRTREELAAAGVDVDHLILHSTHTHMSIDNIGLWGPSLTRSGYDARYHAELRSTIVEAVAEAVGALEPVTMTIGEVDVASYSEDKGVANVVYDTRDPWIIDNLLGAAAFVNRDGETVATLVSFGIHPEAMLGRTAHLSSGFVHALRETVESGVSWDSYDRDGVGGVSVYLNSTVGGMMTTLRVTTTDPDGNDWGSGGSWEKTDAIGQQLGEMALDAIEGGEVVAEPALSVRAKRFFLPIENHAFQAMFLIGIFERTAYNYDPEQPVDESNQPDLQTEIDIVRIGPLELMTMPGEILPELAIGGYDGSYVNAPGHSVIDDPGEHSPDLSQAPEGPYYKDEMSGEYRWIVGLGNDEIGYVIPEYDFVLHDAAPYVLEAEGDHYEETRSLGASTGARLAEEARRLRAYAPEG